uniref:Mic1 domain-containing protein n=1 Tax=Plectus sambesii TaxID=2011161 RepID=A0A914X7K6_9BILA
MLELSSEAVTFEASNSLSEIFFDDVNQKICTVRGNGAIGVVARGPSPRDIITFRLKDNGKIKSMKLAPGCGTVAVQRETSRVDFATLKALGANVVPKEFSQSCKMRNATILGLEWISKVEVLFVTNQGIELYQVNSDKETVKLLKTYNLSIIWFVYYPKCRMLIASSGSNGTILNPFLIQNGVIARIPRFDVDLGSSKLKLLERDVTVAAIYGNVFILVLRHSPRDNNLSDIVMYEINSDPAQCALMTHSLTLGQSGQFAMHVLDSLIVVHHQTTARSMIFDIRVGGVFDGIAHTHRPVVDNIAIAVPNNVSTDPDCSYEPDVELYAPTWVVFPPDLIIDAKVGCMWRIRVELAPAVEIFKDNCALVQFLLHRRTAKRLLLTVLRSLIQDRALTLKDVSTVFDWLSDAYAEHLRSGQKKSGDALQARLLLPLEPFQSVVIEQSDIFNHVFYSLTEEQSMDKKYLVDCMLQYLLSLQERRVEAQPFLHEILVSSLARCEDFVKLQQLLQYRVIADTKPLAFLLLSLEAKHTPLLQLAVDMLARLGTAVEEIVEVLMSKHRIVDALRFPFVSL